MNKHSMRAYILPGLALLAAFICSVGVFAMYGAHNIDADMAGAMTLAAQLNEEGALISANWLYASDLKLIGPELICRAGLMLFDSWHAARVFSAAVMLALTAAAFLYLARGAGLGTEAVWAAAAMMLPTSGASASRFAHGGLYAMHMAAACVILGIVVRLPGRKRAWPSLAALAAAGVWCGANGLRMLTVCGLPLLIACGWCVLMRMMQARTMREAMSGPKRRYLTGALAVNLGMAAGYYLTAALILPGIHSDGMGGKSSEGFGLEMILQQFGDLCGYLGWQGGEKLVSMGGICLFGAVAAAALAVIAPAYLARTRAGGSDGERFIARFAMTAVIFGVLLNAQTNRTGMAYTVTYFIAGLMLSIACAYMLLSRMAAHMPVLRTVFMAALTAIFAVNALQYTMRDMRRDETGCELAADYLAENGLTQGFATSNYAAMLTEASDGAIEVWAYDGWNDTQRSGWMQKASHVDGLPDGRAFVYVEKTELDENENIPCAVAENLAWESEYGCVYVFDDAATVDALQSAQ